MAKEVELLRYWMPILRNLKEFKEIAKAEEPEIRLLLEAVDRTLDNMFIDTADERGIARYEKILNITPEEGDTLDLRRFRVISVWSDKGAYTKEALHEMLTSYCGKDNFEIIEKYADYIIEIVTSLPIAGSFDAVSELLKDVIPANMIVELRNELSSEALPPVYVAGVSSIAKEYTIDQELFTEVVQRITAEIPVRSVVAGSIGLTVTVDTN